MCLSPGCRRAAVLSHFGELPSARSDPARPCCDACSDPARVAEAVRHIATLGAQRRQQFAGSKHRLDFGKGGAAGSMEFEQDRPWEGLDYDGEGPSRALQDDDELGEGIDSDSEDGEWAGTKVWSAWGGKQEF